MSTEFDIGEMTCFETAEDGASIRLSMKDEAGRSLSLRMPLACLNGLMMTLPGMIKQAMQRQYRDPSMRIVYPVGQFQVELADDFETRILTLATPDGFSVSFALTAAQCQEIATDRRDGVPIGALVN